MMVHLRHASASQGRVLVVALLIIGAYLAGTVKTDRHCLFGVPIEFVGER
jgi:hypothetical protein